jgi:alpha-amylase
MNSYIRFCLVLHNHQPIGNFDHVIQQAYEESYLPFLEVFEQFPELNISLHTSGPLMEWLDQHHPDYLQRISKLVAAGRIEIIGGAFYEPILTMIPARDRVGQITSYTQWLSKRLSAEVNGMWIPERVWEQSLTADLAAADIQYCVLDDYHFRKAGISQEKLSSYFVTEDEGRTTKVFPGNEQLRYLIPFADPDQTINLLREQAERHPGSVAVFGDDGEKFGTWPDTHRHVYEQGWLRQFFQALTDNRDWLNTCTLGEAATQAAPAGKIYLPDCSYREMTEWSLPVSKQSRLDDLRHAFQDDPRWQDIQQFVQGGFWRNFKIKYPETNDMYARMMQVSHRLEESRAQHETSADWQQARQDLYRGQCNCSYWHGAFGGIYLPHLRNAVYQHLIAAEKRLDHLDEKPQLWIQSDVADFNFDGQNEVRLASNQLTAWIAPHAGGQLYELDVREICHNLQATIARRPEAYHEKVRRGAHQSHDQAASIHDRVVFKQAGLEQRLQYDQLKRNSLIDHFYDNDVRLEQIVQGQAMERGDFASGRYSTKLRKNPDRIQVQLVRLGNAWGIPLTINKAITMNASGELIQIAYLLEGLPQDRDLHFSVEFNLAGLPAGAGDRFFHRSQKQLGDLSKQLDLQGIYDLNLTDQWLGIDVGFKSSRPTGYWTYPVQTVSQSEAGFELVHQAVAVQPHWLIRGDAKNQWLVTIDLTLDCSIARSRHAAELSAVN